MDLEEYWGVGPKTSELLTDALGVERAMNAIESGDLRTLVDAGVDRGRATRILRRAESEDGMDALATRDTRAVYRELLDLAVEEAVTRSAADRIRTLTPLVALDAMEARQDQIEQARDSWRSLDEATRERILDAYEGFDGAGSRREAALRTALTIADAGVEEGVFEPFAELNQGQIEAAADALGAVEGDQIVKGADDELDRLREAVSAVESMAAAPADIVEAVRSGGVRGTTGFRDELLDYLRSETSVDPTRIRESMPDSADDANAFVTETLRALADELCAARDERAETVRASFSADLDAAGDAVGDTVEAVEDVALWLSLARFADAYDLSRPTYVTDQETVAFVAGRNLTLAADDNETVDPVSYAIGNHTLDAPNLPAGDQVTVVTGANSGGKTTLLETCAQVALLATMGLPVPADDAAVTPPRQIVFHRRHASFNAGVLESTLRSVVPPVTDDGRTLMLVDEFEAITEPGRAADLLHGLVTLTVEEAAIGSFVTHLADDLEPLPDAARIDGIFAEGLTPELELRVDYQPRFGEVGKSTPEFIVSRLLANAADRTERAGFQVLAESVGSDVVQRTLADARFNE